MRYVVAVAVTIVAVSLAAVPAGQVAGGLTEVYRHWWSAVAVAGAVIATGTAWLLAVRRVGVTRRR